jgi:hypothetical protein
MNGMSGFNEKANIAMHPSRHRKASIFAEHTLRPGDGER